jgi:DNA-binding IclR family transcriptional regulator
MRKAVPLDGTPDPLAAGIDTLKAGRTATSIEKALEVCEALSGAPRGLSLRELSRTLALPPSTVHRLLGVLRRRGYVRQDEETSRYGLTLKMLDISFRLLGRSELRLHAYPVVREHVLRGGGRAFVAVPALGEVTYVWTAGPDEVAMHTAYGREMPGHCSVYLTESSATRRLSCLRLCGPGDLARAAATVVRFGPDAGPVASAKRLNCTCAPVFDYTGREVSRVGLFAHGADEDALATTGARHAWELARAISLRLGHLPAASLPVTA